MTRGLTVREASEQTGYNAEYLRRLIRQNEIKAEIVGFMYLIDRQSLWAYVERMKQSDDPRAGPRD
jgi:excisionase family DNA binding protein